MVSAIFLLGSVLGCLAGTSNAATSCSATPVPSPGSGLNCGSEGYLTNPSLLEPAFAESGLSGCAAACEISSKCASFSWMPANTSCTLFTELLDSQGYLNKVANTSTYFYARACFGCAPAPSSTSTTSKSSSTISSKSSSTKTSSSKSTSSSPSYSFSSSSTSITSSSSGTSSASPSSTPTTSAVTVTSSTTTSTTTTTSQMSTTPTASLTPLSSFLLQATAGSYPDSYWASVGPNGYVLWNQDATEGTLFAASTDGTNEFWAISGTNTIAYLDDSVLPPLVVFATQDPSIAGDGPLTCASTNSMGGYWECSNAGTDGTEFDITCPDTDEFRLELSNGTVPARNDCSQLYLVQYD